MESVKFENIESLLNFLATTSCPCGSHNRELGIAPPEPSYPSWLYLVTCLSCGVCIPVELEEDIF